MKKILVIDDSEGNLLLIETVLPKYIPGCKVYTAINGKRGIEKTRQIDPDLVLLDIRMPGLDGFEVAEILKEDNITKHIPIIFLSGNHTDSKSIIKGLDIGADAYLPKPIKNDELAAQVRTGLRIKEAEDKLRKESMKYKLMTETMPDAVMTMNHQQQITLVSNKTLELFGYSESSELVGKKLVDFVVNEQRDMVHDTLNEITTNLQIKNVELRFIRKDKSKFFGELNGTYIATDKTESEEIIIVIRDVTEKKTAHQKIIDYQKKLKTLNSNLSLAEERERKAIAGALHDGLGQILAITSLQLNSLLNHPLDPKISKKIEDSNASIRQAIKETKSITYDLSPPILYELGLIPTIKWRLEQIEDIHGISTNLKVAEDNFELNNDNKILLYRTVSELLNNVLKHSHANSIKVVVEIREECLIISVIDNGKGFNVNKGLKFTAEHGFGLFSIYERLNFVNGEMKINSKEDQGVKATIKIPLVKIDTNEN